MFPVSSTSLVTLKYLDAILGFVTTPVENTELIALHCSACPVREQSSPYPWPEHLWHFAGFIIFVSSVAGRFISCPLNWMVTLSPGEPLFWLYWQLEFQGLCQDFFLDENRLDLFLQISYWTLVVVNAAAKFISSQCEPWSSTLPLGRTGHCIPKSCATGVHNHWELQIYETVFVATTPK